VIDFQAADDLNTLKRSLKERGKDRSFHVPGAKRIREAQLQLALKAIYKHRMEGLRLYMALPHLEPFHACEAMWRIVDGSNRASKTFTCMAECCRAWTGSDPYDKYVRANGKALVVGKESDDVARLWRSVSESSFKMIPDEHTGLYRAVRPNPSNPSELDPYDLAYQEKWKDAPPLLPSRCIGNVAWEDRGKGVPRYVNIKTTGWMTLYRSSNGKATQGDHWNSVHLDEQLLDEDHFKEANRGLAQLASEPDKHRPKGVWSATSQTTNLQLFDLREAADAGAEHVKAFKTTIEQNPYMTPDAKRAFWETLDDDDRAVRYYGEYALIKAKIYGIYNQRVHCCDPFPIPGDWCRYVILDPASEHTGTLFVAVDPENTHMYVYDGFDLLNADAVQWAAEVQRRQGDTHFEAFVCDQQMGGNRMPGNLHGNTVARQYFKALEDAGVKPVQLGPMEGFFPGSNDMLAREKALLAMMGVRGMGPHAGTAKLQVMLSMAPEKLHGQIKKAHRDPKTGKRRYGKGIRCDLLDCLEYAAYFDPQYSEPVPLDKPKEDAEVTALDMLKRKRERQRRRAG